jgi:prepilin-type N-terminal cleavage/methylation domain-containing protein
MKLQREPSSRVSSKPRGFTLLEFIVAMVIFGIAFAGMFPLLSILSRDMFPLRAKTSPYNYTYFTPSRDWESDADRHTWYLVPFSEPWARKLGASARITSSSTAFTSYDPLSIETSLVSRDDDTDATDSDSDGYEDYTDVASDNNWQSGTVSSSITDRQDYRFHDSLLDSSFSASATWSIQVAKAGWYSIQATWPTGTGKTLTTVNYALSGTATSNLTTTQCSCDVSQASPSYSVTDATGTWYNVTSTAVYLDVGMLQVKLTVPIKGATTYSILADGVRMVQNIVSIDDSGLVRTPNDTTETVTANVTVSVRIPQ